MSPIALLGKQLRSAQELYEKAQQHLRAGAPTEAAVCCVEALEMGPDRDVTRRLEVLERRAQKRAHAQPLIELGRFEADAGYAT